MSVFGNIEGSAVGGGFGGSVVVSAVCDLVLAEIMSWMLALASDPGARLGIGIWVFRVVGLVICRGLLGMDGSFWHI